MALFTDAILTTTEFLSGYSRWSIGAVGLRDLTMLPAPGLAPAANVSQLHLTSSVVITRLLVGGRGSHLLLARSLKVTLSPSGAISNDCAASPSNTALGRLAAVPVVQRKRRW